MIEGGNGHDRSFLGDDERPLDEGLGGVFVLIPDHEDIGFEDMK